MRSLYTVLISHSPHIIEPQTSNLKPPAMNIESYFKISYGIYVVSTVQGSKRNGYISNTVFQVTAEPAQMAIVCSKNNFTAEMISRSKVFSISVLKKDTRNEIMGAFGYRSGKDMDKFAQFAHITGKTGAPILLDDTVAWFECEVTQTLDVGSHMLFIGRVTDCDLIDSQGEPLTYAYYRDVKKGKAPKNAPTFIDPEKLKQKAGVVSGEYYCTVCGHIYNPVQGDPESGIPPGTPFEDLPESWVCPVCGAEKSDFAKKN